MSDSGSGDSPERAVPYLCPFCGEEDLRPEPQGRWVCRSCCRIFSVAFHGLQPFGQQLETVYTAPGSGSQR